MILIERRPLRLGALMEPALGRFHWMSHGGFIDVVPKTLSRAHGQQLLLEVRLLRLW